MNNPERNNQDGEIPLNRRLHLLDQFATLSEIFRQMPTYLERDPKSHYAQMWLEADEWITLYEHDHDHLQDEDLSKLVNDVTDVLSRFISRFKSSLYPGYDDVHLEANQVVSHYEIHQRLFEKVIDLEATLIYTKVIIENKKVLAEQRLKITQILGESSYVAAFNSSKTLDRELSKLQHNLQIFAYEIDRAGRNNGKISLTERSNLLKKTLPEMQQEVRRTNRLLMLF